MTCQKILKNLSLIAAAAVLVAAVVPHASGQTIWDSNLFSVGSETEECLVILPVTTRDIVATPGAAPENLGLFTRDETVNDRIVGGFGGEQIYGGRGSDVLTGNGGGDFFNFEGVYMNDGDHDFVTDFELLTDKLTAADSAALVSCKVDCEGNVVLCLTSTWVPNPADMKVTLLGVTKEDVEIAARMLCINTEDGLSQEELQHVFGGSGPFGDCEEEEEEGEEQCEVVLPETTRDIFGDPNGAPGNVGLLTRDENVNDNIVGTYNGEHIFGGKGSDVLTGGFGGGDFFHFEGAYMDEGDHDFITDFNLFRDQLTSQDSATVVSYSIDCEGNVVLLIRSTWPQNPVEMKVTLLGVTEDDLIMAGEIRGFDTEDGISQLELRAIVG